MLANTLIHPIERLGYAVAVWKLDGKIEMRANKLVPGDRVDDVYEVCGPVVKCHIWLGDRVCARRLKERLAKGSTFVKGDQALLKQMQDPGNKNGFRFQVVIVQPGITKGALTEKLAHVLVAADDYVPMRDRNCFKCWHRHDCRDL